MKSPIKNKFLFTLFLALGVLASCSQNSGQNMADENKINEMTDTTIRTDTATFGAGCFWCVEAIFQNIKGVLSVQSGYAGGHMKNPTYNEVCSGKTGHAEVARIIFDPALVSYDQLLEVFWHSHDPTTMNRQGADVGDQYRSVIFYHSDIQKIAAEISLKKTDAGHLWSDPIVTSIVSLNNYYSAEDYHQNYFAQNPEKGYCSAVIAPKVAKFRKEFKNLLKE